MAHLSCFGRRFRRTAPANGESGDEPIIAPQHSRVNGWSCPLHVLQLVAWIIYGFMAVISFGVYIPLLPAPWNHVSYGLVGAAFVVHFLSHVAAVSLDPADRNVRLRKDYSTPMPMFDRKKQPHVIHNQHCFLCQVDVGPKVKHCSSCNKCISDFDHHCKWLNNCVGGRNYWFFLATLLSAGFGALLIAAVVSFVFIGHFVNPDVLRTAPAFQAINRNTTWLAFLPLAPVETGSASLLVLALVTVILALASFFLLCHLLIFHIYLLFNGLSTYEYVMKRRHLQSSRQQNAGSTSSSDEASPQSTGPSDRPVECNGSLSGTMSIFKYQEGAQLSNRLSGAICSEMEDFPPAADGEKHLKASIQIVPGAAPAGGSASVGRVERPRGTAGICQAKGDPVAQSRLGSSVLDTS